MVSLEFFFTLSLYECGLSVWWGRTQEMASISPGQTQLGQPMPTCQCAGLEGRAKKEAQERSQTLAGIQLFTIHCITTVCWEQLPRLVLVKYKTGSFLLI